MVALLFFLWVILLKKSIKEKYISSAFLLLVSTVIVKMISAFYKIPLTSYIGATGRGYFSIAYNLCLPIHALTMGAFLSLCQNSSVNITQAAINSEFPD